MSALMTETKSWQSQGACLDEDPEMFFHPDQERGSARDERDAAAKAVCAGCDVLEQCREWSIETRQKYGVWGGMSEDERATHIRRLQRARKAVAA